MKKLKVVTIVGTRPEIIKLCRVIAELDKLTDHVLVHTGQNYDYELNEIFFEELGIRRPDYFLEAAENTACATAGKVIAEAEKVLVREKPDAVLILGDTNSCLAAYSAKRLHIPIFHMEAGNRCFDLRVPEEINRKIVDHISDMNLTYSEHARRYLLAEGLPAERVIKTGSPMYEVLDYYHAQIAESDILTQLKLTPEKYFLVSAHREENVDSPVSLQVLLSTLDELTRHYQYPVIFSTHPRTRARLEAMKDFKIAEQIHFVKPQGFFDYNKLQQSAFCVLSDSGTITEESSILNFPAVTIREAQERPEGMDEATLIMSGLTKERVLQSVMIVTEQYKAEQRQFHQVADYSQDNVSMKVVRIIHSFVDYINRVVWFKHR